MKVVVYGAGAIGGFIAWKLATSGATDISVVARGAQREAIADGNLQLFSSGALSAKVAVPATDDSATLGRQDLIVVTVKQSALAGIADALAAMSGPDTVVVFAQNGVPWWAEPDQELLDPGRRLQSLIPTVARVGCVVRTSAAVMSPGVIGIDTTKARLILGGPPEARERGLKIAAEILGGAGISVSVALDLLPMVWGKLMMNVGLSVPAAILGLTVGDVVRDPELRGLAEDLFREIETIARSRGVTPLFRREEVDAPAVAHSLHRPSLLQDLEQGRLAEIDALVNVPLAIARDAKLPTPVLDGVARLIRGKARSLGSYQRHGEGA